MNKSYFHKIALFSIFCLLGPIMVYAANDVSVTEGSSIQLSSGTFTVETTSSLNNFVVDGASVTATIEAGGVFSISSSDRHSG